MIAGVLIAMGVGVTVGIVLAAFVISVFLVPAVTALTGRTAWWPGHADEPSGAATSAAGSVRT